jgi:hypothetical protein
MGNDNFLDSRSCAFAKCGKTFQPARSNQNYCCHGHQVMANNARAKSVRDGIKNVEQQLKENRAVLAELWMANRFTTTYDELISKGYDLGFHTHILRHEKDNQYLYFVYDFGFKLNPDKTYQILHKDELQSNDAR